MNVFISYSNRDEEWADLLREKLNAAADENISVWNPASEITPGENWALKYGKALEQSDAVIVLLSPDSVKSDWVRHEIEYVLSSPKFRDRLIPIMVRPTKDVPWILRTLTFIDAGTVEDTAAKVIAALKKRTSTRKSTARG